MQTSRRVILRYRFYFFPAQYTGHSWINAAAAVLDVAVLSHSTVDIPQDFQADLFSRAGYLALHHITDYFCIEYNPDPTPDDPIRISCADSKQLMSN